MATGSTIQIPAQGGEITWTATSDPTGHTISATSPGSWASASGSRVSVEENRVGQADETVTVTLPPNSGHRLSDNTNGLSYSISASFQITGESYIVTHKSNARSGSAEVTVETNATAGYSGSIQIICGYTINQAGMEEASYTDHNSMGLTGYGGSSSLIGTGGSSSIKMKKGGSVICTWDIGVQGDLRTGDSLDINVIGAGTTGQYLRVTADGVGSAGGSVSYEIRNINSDYTIPTAEIRVGR